MLQPTACVVVESTISVNGGMDENSPAFVVWDAQKAILIRSGTPPDKVNHIYLSLTMMMSFYALSECNYFISAVFKLSLFHSSPEVFLSLHFVLVFFISPSQDVSLLQFRGVCVSNEFSNPLFILSSIEGCLNPQQQDGIQKVIISPDCTNSSKLSI